MINNLQTLTNKLYKTNDTLVLDGDFVDNIEDGYNFNLVIA